MNQTTKSIQDFTKHLVERKAKEYEKEQIPRELWAELMHLHQENAALRLGLETLKKILIKKKVATKREIDVAIDAELQKKVRRYE